MNLEILDKNLLTRAIELEQSLLLKEVTPLYCRETGQSEYSDFDYFSSLNQAKENLINNFIEFNYNHEIIDLDLIDSELDNVDCPLAKKEELKNYLIKILK